MARGRKIFRPLKKIEFVLFRRIISLNPGCMCPSTRETTAVAFKYIGVDRVGCTHTAACSTKFSTAVCTHGLDGT